MQNKFIKSALNYTGGKYKLLPQIIPQFSKDYDRFIDLFAGGATVSANISFFDIFYVKMIQRGMEENYISNTLWTHSPPLNNRDCGGFVVTNNFFEMNCIIIYMTCF